MYFNDRSFGFLPFKSWLLTTSVGLSSSSFYFMLRFEPSSCINTLIPATKFKVSLKLIYLSTIPSKSIISLGFFLKRDNYNGPCFNHLISDCIMYVIDRSTISNTSKLKHEIYSRKDSHLLFLTLRRLMAIFFGFLLLMKCAINCCANSIKESIEFGSSVEYQFQAIFLNINGKDLYIISSKMPKKIIYDLKN